MSTADTMLFHSLRYHDAPAALAYLVAGLGFTSAADHRDPEDETVVHHAQLNWPGGGGIMFGSTTEPAQVGSAFAYLVVATDADVDALHTRALAHGFTEDRAPQDMDYGGRSGTLRDPEGNTWSVGSYPGE